MVVGERGLTLIRCVVTMGTVMVQYLSFVGKH
ncbi:MAG: hypothetical protein ACI9BK_002304 [Acidimicrobiales bacterium]|jgi:hypothetical protein